MRPNIFDFATSELSQDAALAWILAWADPSCADSDDLLHRLGRRFLREIYARHEADLPEELASVSVATQKYNVDVLVEVGSRDVVVLEDKAGSREHSEQLPRYVREAGARYEKARILPIYVQTFEQPSLEGVRSAGYGIIDRTHLIEMLDWYEREGGTNDIAVDLLARLREVDKAFNCYLSASGEEWGWYGWQGFFKDIRGRLGGGTWDYVANPSGGFFGFWFGGVSADGVDVYAQLEQDQLCFKIAVQGDSSQRSDARARWHRAIMTAAEDARVALRRPARFGHGRTMTVAIYDGEYRAFHDDKTIDLERTVARLRELSGIIGRAVQQ